MARKTIAEKAATAYEMVRELRRTDEFMRPSITKAVQLSGYTSLEAWSKGNPKEFLKFAEMCDAVVDDGNDDAYSPNPETGERWA